CGRGGDDHAGSAGAARTGRVDLEIYRDALAGPVAVAGGTEAFGIVLGALGLFCRRNRRIVPVIGFVELRGAFGCALGHGAMMGVYGPARKYPRPSSLRA